MPAAATRTSASPGPGCGTGRRASLSTSGGPGDPISTAFMVSGRDTSAIESSAPGASSVSRRGREVGRGLQPGGHLGDDAETPVDGTDLLAQRGEGPRERRGAGEAGDAPDRDRTLRPDPRGERARE